MITINTFILNPFQVNTYVVHDDDTAETMIIDCGVSNDHEARFIKSYVEENNLKVKYVVNTHCHIDHIFGNHFAVNEYNAALIVPKDDEFLLDKLPEQANMFGLDYKMSPVPDDYLTVDKVLSLGANKFYSIPTPGHSPGGTCLLNENNNICFTGDTLFCEGIGRTDLWGASFDALIDSIKDKLFALPPETKIYPGHGDSSTIGHEKENNPFIM